jgi:hypothetical protein
MKVFELAKELNTENKILLQTAKGLGFEIKSHMSNLEDDQVEQIKEVLGVDTSKNDSDNSSISEISKPTPKPQTNISWKPDLTRMICLKNIASGKLIYKSKRKIGYKIEWEKPGDTNYIELDEFINLKNSDSRFVTEPWIRIIEDDEIEILKYANIFKYYEEILGLKNVSDILLLDFESFKKKFDKLPSGYKNSVVEQAAKMIKNGELDSIKIKNYIEKDMGLDLDILLQSDNKPVDNSINIK